MSVLNNQVKFNGGAINIGSNYHWRHYNGQEITAGATTSNYDNGVIINLMAFDVDSDATLAGVPVGEFYILTSSNFYGGVAETPKRNLGID